MIQPPLTVSLFQPGGVLQICSILAVIFLLTFIISLNFENFCLLKKRKHTPHHRSLSFPSTTSTSTASSFFFYFPFSLKHYIPLTLNIVLPLSFSHLLISSFISSKHCTSSFSSLKSPSDFLSACTRCLFRLSYVVFLFVSLG